MTCGARRLPRVLALCATAATASASAPAARADFDEPNFLAGPVFGITVPNRDGQGGGLLGLEAGAGWGPQRLNIGFEHRDGESFGYLELDPWLVVGASVGFGLGSETGWHPILGVWEGIPLSDICQEGGRVTMFTIAAGYRYTGVHEFYVTPKVGTGPSICLD